MQSRKSFPNPGMWNQRGQQLPAQQIHPVNQNAANVPAAYNVPQAEANAYFLSQGITAPWQMNPQQQREWQEYTEKYRQWHMQYGEQYAQQNSQYPMQIGNVPPLPTVEPVQPPPPEDDGKKDKKGKGSKNKPESLEELVEAEKAFHEQFKNWEKSFLDWKEQNANHPDKKQYEEYQSQWESWREQLTQKYQLMKKKREAKEAEVAAAQKEAQEKARQLQEKLHGGSTGYQAPGANFMPQYGMYGNVPYSVQNTHQQPPPLPYGTNLIPGLMDAPSTATAEIAPSSKLLSMIGDSNKPLRTSDDTPFQSEESWMGRGGVTISRGPVRNPPPSMTTDFTRYEDYDDNRELVADPFRNNFSHRGAFRGVPQDRGGPRTRGFSGNRGDFPGRGMGEDGILRGEREVVGGYPRGGAAARDGMMRAGSMPGDGIFISGGMARGGAMSRGGAGDGFQRSDFPPPAPKDDKFAKYYEDDYDDSRFRDEDDVGRGENGPPDAKRSRGMDFGRGSNFHQSASPPSLMGNRFSPGNRGGGPRAPPPNSLGNFNRPRGPSGNFAGPMGGKRQERPPFGDKKPPRSVMGNSGNRTPSPGNFNKRSPGPGFNRSEGQNLGKSSLLRPDYLVNSNNPNMANLLAKSENEKPFKPVEKEKAEEVVFLMDLKLERPEPANLRNLEFEHSREEFNRLDEQNVEPHIPMPAPVEPIVADKFFEYDHKSGPDTSFIIPIHIYDYQHGRNKIKLPEEVEKPPEPVKSSINWAELMRENAGNSAQNEAVGKERLVPVEKEKSTTSEKVEILEQKYNKLEEIIKREDRIPSQNFDRLPRNKMSIEELLLPPARFSRNSQIIIIMRGLPGSGKSYAAKLIKDKEVEMGGSAPRILSLDDYFMTEVDVEQTDQVTGKTTTNKEMKYVYDPEMEPSYVESLMKSLKKTMIDGFFPFIILDCPNIKVKDYEDVVLSARSSGFQVYVCEMDGDVELCSKQNIHDRKLEDIKALANEWEKTVAGHSLLDIECLLHSTTAITEVDMEDISSDEENNMGGDAEDERVENTDNDNGEDDDEAAEYVTSKWEQLENTKEKLARLDGVGKKKVNSIDEWLKSDDLSWYTGNGQEEDEQFAANGKPKKRVRWADLEEKIQQEKMRAIGFVVGQTDWKRMMDPTEGGSKLTQTKYIYK